MSLAPNAFCAPLRAEVSRKLALKVYSVIRLWRVKRGVGAHTHGACVLCPVINCQIKFFRWQRTVKPSRFRRIARASIPRFGMFFARAIKIIN